MKPLAICAGSRRQFDELWYKPDRDKGIYIANVETAMSGEWSGVRYIGTFWQRDDADMIAQVVLARIR